jgi:hypothetical protein
MMQCRLALQALTYISIGFFVESIYAEDNFGIDHNMLLADRVWAHLGHPSVSGDGMLTVSHTFVLSPQSVAIMLGSANWC